MHPLRQTSFPASIDNDQRAFSATSDAGSVTGSFTGSLGGTSADGVFLGAAKKGKRGRKSKAEKEREREQREDAASLRGDTRLGSVDADGMSVRAGGTARGDAAGEEGDEDEDFDDEGELLRGEEGVTDTEAEKKNLAYVSLALLLTPWVSYADVGLLGQKVTGGCVQSDSVRAIRSIQTGQAAQGDAAANCQPRAVPICACQCRDHHQRIHQGLCR